MKQSRYYMKDLAGRQPQQTAASCSGRLASRSCDKKQHASVAARRRGGVLTFPERSTPAWQSLPWQPAPMWGSAPRFWARTRPWHLDEGQERGRDLHKRAGYSSILHSTSSEPCQTWESRTLWCHWGDWYRFLVSSNASGFRCWWGWITNLQSVNKASFFGRKLKSELSFPNDSIFSLQEAVISG